MRNSEAFFTEMRRKYYGLTFEDVALIGGGIELERDQALIIPGYTEVFASGVSLTTRFSRNISMNIPLVSAAMDRVTEHSLAIELALLGGIGIIHRNLGTDRQAWEVSRVKHFQYGGLIPKPIVVQSSDTIRDILERCEIEGFKFRSLPVLDADGHLVGLLTSNNFKFCRDTSLSATVVMTKRSDVLTGLPDLSIDDAFELMQRTEKGVLPLVDLDNRLCGLYLYKDLERARSGDSTVANIDGRGRLRVGAAIGGRIEELERVATLIDADVDIVVIDVAQGNSSGVVELVRKIKYEFPSLEIGVGNVATGDGVQRLADAGADMIKIGIGAGSICTTRIVGGIGVPQLTAIAECATAAESCGVPICADGGIKHSGDIVKAIGAGAHTVMVGSILAGTEEAPGEKFYLAGKWYKEYRGMGSEGAIRDRGGEGSRLRYGGGIVAEGVEGRVPYKGSVSNIINDCTGGIRKGMEYVGAATIDALRDGAEFILLTTAGVMESHPHDIEITKEAPNYFGQ